MQVLNIKTNVKHQIKLESEGRCECCGNHVFKVLVDNNLVFDIKQQSDGTTIYTTETESFISDKTLNALRKASGYLSAKEFWESI